MTGPGWLGQDGPDEWRIERIDPCEAGTCGHPHGQPTKRRVGHWVKTADGLVRAYTSREALALVNGEAYDPELTLPPPEAGGAA